MQIYIIELAKHLSEAYIMSTFMHCPLIWMFCSKTANNLINKIHKRSLRVGRCKYGRFIKDRSWTIHENNIHTLLTLLTHLSSYNFWILKLLIIVFEITIY